MKQDMSQCRSVCLGPLCEWKGEESQEGTASAVAGGSEEAYSCVFVRTHMGVLCACVCRHMPEATSLESPSPVLFAQTT